MANLFDPIPPEITAEIIQVLLATGQFSPGAHRLQRARPRLPGEWYDQDTHEWVALLSGGAGLRFEDEAEPRVLSPGGLSAHPGPPPSPGGVDRPRDPHRVAGLALL